MARWKALCKVKQKNGEWSTTKSQPFEQLLHKSQLGEWSLLKSQLFERSLLKCQLGRRINYEKSTWENPNFSNGCKSHSIVHRLHLNGAGALLVNQVVVECRVRTLVAEEVVRQLDLDLLRTHDYHFVEQTNRHLWERLGVMKPVKFEKSSTCKSSATLEMSSATVTSRRRTGLKTVSPRWAR